MDWSKLQMDIFTHYTDTDSNLAIKAGPGSGKTTVLKELCRLTSPKEDSIFLAFNRSIVEELSKKLPRYVEVSTLHSLGMRSVIRAIGKVKVDEWKSFSTLRKISKNWELDSDKKKVNSYFFNLCSLYDMYRVYYVDKDDFTKLSDVALKHGIEFDDKIYEHFLLLDKALSKMLRVGDGGVRVIDFVDMIYLPVKYNYTLTKFDNVFIDESQDLSIIQHMLVDKLLHVHSRVVSVGDEKQSIYAFIGADEHSFERFTLRPNTVTLPLNITYRCDKEIVELANTVFEDSVIPRPNCRDGIVRDGTWEEIVEGDMVLCRVNKDLLQLYIKLLASGIKSYVKGADFGKDLIKVIEPYSNYSLDNLLTQMNLELDELYRKLSEQGIEKPRNHSKFVRYEENIQLVEILSSYCESTRHLVSEIGRIFRDDGEGVMLSTIHKTKGLESERVFILNRHLIPSKHATQEWEKEQENKLLFVAYTRAKSELIFIKI